MCVSKQRVKSKVYTKIFSATENVIKPRKDKFRWRTLQSVAGQSVRKDIELKVFASHSSIKIIKAVRLDGDRGFGLCVNLSVISRIDAMSSNDCLVHVLHGNLVFTKFTKFELSPSASYLPVRTSRVF